MEILENLELESPIIDRIQLLFTPTKWNAFMNLKKIYYYVEKIKIKMNYTQVLQFRSNKSTSIKHLLTQKNITLPFVNFTKI